ncbi:MAG: hypothetical protein KBS96_03105 [Lachnospiraceae bacterium]|nr:hypothetical protein [Candidatus Colinaster scatohippi]
MQEDFHYYATYCAAYIAGYSHKEAYDIAYSAQFVDCCSRTLLSKIKAPSIAATTQLQLEMMDLKISPVVLQDITRIWASFHFLPYDLNAPLRFRTQLYKWKYRLICNPNGKLVEDTVNLASNSSIQAVGIAMHVLADTWAHRYFAGTPSLVINNTNYHFYELLENGERHVDFKHNPVASDDVINGHYTNSLYQSNENSIMNLGHGRAGHFPDYSFARYKYLPAWNDYKEVLKDNPEEYYQAFCQMVFALQYLRGSQEFFELNRYAYEAVAPYEKRIREILLRRQINGNADWKALAEQLSGETIEDFDIEKYQQEYMAAPKGQKETTFLGSFISAAIAQKTMVTTAIFKSGNLLAGFTKIVPQK